MVSLGWSWLLVAVLAAEPPPLPEALPLTFGLRFVDPEGVVPFPLEGVQAEVERLFSPLGVRVVPADEAGDSVQVVLLAADRSRGGLPAEAMGAVARHPQGPPAVWIVLPNVRRILGGEGRQWPAMPGFLLARAMGRVLAHELVHLIAPDLPHAPEGLMRASLGRSLLLRESIALDPALGPTVRFRLAAGRLKRPPLA